MEGYSDFVTLESLYEKRQELAEIARENGTIGQIGEGGLFESFDPSTNPYHGKLFKRRAISSPNQPMSIEISVQAKRGYVRRRKFQYLRDITLPSTHASSKYPSSVFNW